MVRVARLLPKLAWFAVLFTWCAGAWADYQLNMTRGVTEVSQDVFTLHMTIFWICCGIAVLVFGVMFYALIFHRKSRGVKPAEFHEHPTLEIIWAIIPFLILILMAIPATKVLVKMDNTEKADVNIKVTGYQWKWRYDYMEEGFGYFSNLSTSLDEITNKKPKGKWYLLEVDNAVVVPINKKIRFLVTSADVIHSWWVPAFAIKRDAVPGFMHEAWTKIQKPGLYRGQCAELCGVNHAYMPIVVKAVPQAEYDKWVKEQYQAKLMAAAKSAKKWTKDELMDLGKKTYQKFCVACHKENGEGMPPVFPALKASSVAVGGDVTRHIKMVLEGVPGTAMQAFDTQLTDAEIAAVVTYERNAWDNNTGDIVQPSDVKLTRAQAN